MERKNASVPVSLFLARMRRCTEGGVKAAGRAARGKSAINCSGRRGRKLNGRGRRRAWGIIIPRLFFIIPVMAVGSCSTAFKSNEWHPQSEQRSRRLTVPPRKTSRSERNLPAGCGLGGWSKPPTSGGLAGRVAGSPQSRWRPLQRGWSGWVARLEHLLLRSQLGGLLAEDAGLPTEIEERGREAMEVDARVVRRGWRPVGPSVLATNG